MSDKNIEEVISDLKSYLEYCKQVGIKELPLKENIKQVTKNESSKNDNRIETEPLNDLFISSLPKQSLEEIKDDLGECTRCKLHSTRNNIVFGEGNPNARLVFVGEGPGRDEDMQGRPFVGRAGQLLTRIIKAMGLEREDVYICNVVKCRPPENRNPEPDEVANCEPFLFRQIRSIDPEVIVCLGSVATGLLLKLKNFKMGQLRGTFHQYGNSKLMITYHPAALLRNPNFKKPVWEDMQLVMKELDLPLPG
ncbi:MAG: uracil-DNA glycosylase [Candidatus Dadabacteria bacterium]|nr:uracil-DNA glycosylase [Candidatus Dadabacteria bacterium]NIQ14089.1 uracil-DNA glycosylase [Candidatus Dadabacteria bacterium]